MDWTVCNTARDFAVQCTRIYQPEFAHTDPIRPVRQRLLSRAAPAEMVVNCVAATDIADRDHRSRIYDRFDLRERWSIAQRIAPGRALTLSLLKRTDQSRMDRADIDLLLRVAPLLMALVRRDRELAPHEGTPLPPRAKLLARSPDLAARELEVCLCLLQGLTLDATAAELRLKKSTIETYRDRAYGKLDIHFRSQLFALAR